MARQLVTMRMDSLKRKHVMKTNFRLKPTVFQTSLEWEMILMNCKLHLVVNTYMLRKNSFICMMNPIKRLKWSWFYLVTQEYQYRLAPSINAFMHLSLFEHRARINQLLTDVMKSFSRNIHELFSIRISIFIFLRRVDAYFPYQCLYEKK